MPPNDRGTFEVLLMTEGTFKVLLMTGRIFEVLPMTGGGTFEGVLITGGPLKA